MTKDVGILHEPERGKKNVKAGGDPQKKGGGGILRK